jgi:hypothetical protein
MQKASICKRLPGLDTTQLLLYITSTVIVNLTGFFNLELKLMPSYYLEMLLQNPMLRNESSYHLI